MWKMYAVNCGRYIAKSVRYYGSWYVQVRVVGIGPGRLVPNATVDPSLLPTRQTARADACPIVRGAGNTRQDDGGTVTGVCLH